MGIDSAINNLEKNKDFVSFIHTKRYTTLDPYGKNFSNLRYDEYQQIFDILLSKESDNSNITIHDVRKYEFSDEIYFSVKENYDYCYVKIISLFRPNKEYNFNMTLNNENLYYIIKENDIWIKDCYLTIEQNRIIKDIVKIF